MIRFMDDHNILSIEALKNGIDYSGDLLDSLPSRYNVQSSIYTVDDVADVAKSAFVNGNCDYDIGVYVYPLIKDMSYSGYDDDLGGVVIDCDIIDFTNYNNYGIANIYKHYKIMVQTLHDDDTGADYLPLSTNNHAGDLITTVVDIDTDMDYDFTPEDLGEELYNIVNGIINSVVPSASDLYSYGI